MSQTKAVSETEDRIKDVTGGLKAAVEANREIVASAKMEDGVLIIDEKRRQEFAKNLDTAKQAKELLSQLEDFKGIEDWAATPAGAATAVAVGAQPVHQAVKTVGQAFLESEQYKNRRANGDTEEFFVKGISDLGALWVPEQKDIYSDTPGAGPIAAFGQTIRAPMVTAPERTGRIRDLFPRVVPTTATTIEYFIESGFVNAAAPVPQRNVGNSDFAPKPKSDILYTSESAKVKRIAHWIAAHRDTLADEPVLRDRIDTKLLYGLRLVEDAQILNGDGTGENLRGILQTPGIQAYNHPQDSPSFRLDADPAVAGNQTDVGTDNTADAVRRAATLAYLSFYAPNGVVLHPNDWEEMELTKDKNGQYLLAVSIALGGEPRVWRMRVVDTPVIAEKTALLGSFGFGCTLYDREQSNIRIAEQHEGFFVKNAVAVLAEERVGLTVERPESFVKIDLNTAA